MKIAVITCYVQPDYVRAKILRDCLALIPGVEVIAIKNKSKGVKRYPEVIWQVLKARFTSKPDVYLMTFRWDIFPIVRLISIGKTFILDELVNGIEYFNIEHRKFKGIVAKVFAFGYPILARTAKFILADTESHADVSSALSKIDRRKYVVVPVGADEAAFTYQPYQYNHEIGFRVFFCAYMLPLHGPEFMLEAAIKLKDNPNISFMIGGRTRNYTKQLDEAKRQGARLEYREWIPYAELPQLVRDSAINVSGPFGQTFQAEHVINTKSYQFLASGNLAIFGANKATSLFKNHENCLLVPRGDSDALVREILWAYDNQAKLPEITANGRKLYDEHFSNKIIAKVLEEQVVAKLR